MNKKNIVSTLALLSFLLIAQPAQAEIVVRTGQTVSVGEDKGVVADFYAAASIVNISGTIEGDLVAASGRTTLNGSVSEDILIIGGSVDIHGPVGDDVRIIGGEVIIAEPVAGDVFVIGGTVNILSTASVGGDVLIYGGEVEIAGAVAGNVLGSYGSLRIDAPVGKDVQVTTNELVLGDSAVIAGSVIYKSNTIVQRSPNAVVEKEVVRSDIVGEGENQVQKRYMMGVLMIAFATLLWFLLSRRTLDAVVLKGSEHSPRPILLGLAFLVLLPIVSAVLFTSMLGVLVALTLTFLYLSICLLALFAAPAVIGRLALTIFNQPADNLSLLTLALGMAVSTLLFLIPVIGPLLIGVAVMVSVGAIIDLLVRTHNR